MLFTCFLAAVLPTAFIELDGHFLKVEVADQVETRAKGLMNRESLEKECGMLFIYPESAKLSFWMKETKIPLSVAFFDAEGILLNIEEMAVEPFEAISLPLYQSRGKARYALEVEEGWFARNKVGPGTKFTFRAPP